MKPRKPDAVFHVASAVSRCEACNRPLPGDATRCPTMECMGWSPPGGAASRVLRFAVPGRAVPFQRVGKSGHVPAIERRWRATVADYALQARLRDHGWGWRDEDAFELELVFHRAPPAGKRRGGDASNLAKPVEDAFSALLFGDDRQVRRLVVEIVDAAEGRERVDVVLARRARR